MLKLILPIFLIIFIIPIAVSAQVYDAKESSRLKKFQGKPILVGGKLLRAVQSTSKNTIEQADQSLEVFLELSKNKNLSNTDQIVIKNMIAKYYSDLGDEENTIKFLEELLSYSKKPRAMELGAYLSLAVHYHNVGEYLLSIKNLNRWLIYSPVALHQLQYMLADNYLKLGDIRTAYDTYLSAKKTHENYLVGGPDFGEDMNIANYSKMIENLEGEFTQVPSFENIDDFDPEQIPQPGSDFWEIKFDPKFPTAALRKGRTGSAKIKFDIKGNGKLDNIEVLEASRSLFKKPALSHTRRMIFIRYKNTNDEFIARNVIYDLDFVFKKK